MKAIEIENASVVGLQNEQVTMQSGDKRDKQVVLFTENTSDGVKLHGCTVWDDNIGKLALRQGWTGTLSCRLVGRQWGGRFNYELVAFKAVENEPKKEGAQDAF